MTSVMYRMVGEPIFEQTLGSADAMLLRLLAGDETEGGTKQPYDPRIHFVLINEAYKAGQPGQRETGQVAGRPAGRLRRAYGGKRPRYLDGYSKLKAAIKPWVKRCSVARLVRALPPALARRSERRGAGGMGSERQGRALPLGREHPARRHRDRPALGIGAALDAEPRERLALRLARRALRRLGAVQRRAALPAQQPGLRHHRVHRH